MKSKIYIIISFLILIGIFSNITFGETAMNIEVNTVKNELNINGSKIIRGDLPIWNNENVLLPMRTILEAIGAIVYWDSNSGNISIDYKDKNFVCKFWENNCSNKYMTVEGDHINNGALKHFVSLNPMSGSGSYEMINDRTYLHQETGKRLFEAMGCIVEIDLENQIVNISN